MMMMMMMKMMMMMMMIIKKEYKKVAEDYRNNKIEYKEIKEKLNKTIDAIKMYKKN